MTEYHLYEYTVPVYHTISYTSKSLFVVLCVCAVYLFFLASVVAQCFVTERLKLQTDSCERHYCKQNKKNPNNWPSKVRNYEVA